MNIKHKQIAKYGCIISLMLIFSLVLGFIFSDYLMLGSCVLFLGCVQTLFLSKGFWWEELFGITEALLVAIVALNANLYGTAIFTAFVYVPLSVFSLVNWKKHQYGGIVKINKMDTQNSILLVLILCISIVVFSFLLSLLPNQNLPVLDTISNMLDICGIILIALRYKEGWIFWILCSLADFVMWGILFLQDKSLNAIMMIIVSVVNIIINMWGFWSFIKIRKQQELKFY